MKAGQEREMETDRSGHNAEVCHGIMELFGVRRTTRRPMVFRQAGSFHATAEELIK